MICWMQAVTQAADRGLHKQDPELAALQQVPKQRIGTNALDALDDDNARLRARITELEVEASLVSRTRVKLLPSEYCTANAANRPTT